MNIQDFINRINIVGEHLSDLNSNILRTIEPIAERIRNDAPEDTGELKRSISFVVESGETMTLFLSMKNYGFFQNYGVQASPDSTTVKRTNQLPVEDVVRFGLPPSGGDKFRFGRKQDHPRAWGAFYSGLDNQQFFTMAAIGRALTSTIQTDTTQFINNTFR